MSDPVVAMKARLVRCGLGPAHLAAYWDPERGKVNPLDELETQQEVRRLIQELWDGKWSTNG